jgi:hypothetical protein
VAPGNLHFVTESDPRLMAMRFSPSGALMTSNEFPDFDFLDDCRVVIADGKTIRIESICTPWPTSTTLPISGSFLYVRVLPNYNLAVSDVDGTTGIGRVREIDLRGNEIRTLAFTQSAPRLSVDPDGRTLWVVDRDSIRRVSLETGATTEGPRHLAYAVYGGSMAVRGEWRPSATPRRRAVKTRSAESSPP